MESQVRQDIRDMLSRIIASGGRIRRSRKMKGRGMYELEGEGLRAYGMRRRTTRARGMSAGLYAGKMKNPWISHVKKYAKQHGITYSEALQSPGVRKGYHKTGMGIKRKMKKTKKMSKKMSSKKPKKMSSKKKDFFF